MKVPDERVTRKVDGSLEWLVPRIVSVLVEKFQVELHAK